MAGDAQELVRLRNDFYRDNYRKVVLALVIAVLALFMVTGVFVYTVTHRAPPRYFATAADGSVLPLVPLNQPNITDAGVLNFGTDTIVNSLSLDFVKWRSELQNMGANFTPEGWNQFEVALQKSDYVKTIQDKKLIALATVGGAPIVRASGLLNGTYAWDVQIPITVSYQGANYVSPQNYMVSMRIVRVSTLANPKGIGVAQVIMQ